MKRLLILRHAKSSWSDPELDDHDRPLNPRGRRDAPRIGRLVQAKEIAPDVIFCSTALRARATAALAVEAGNLTAGLHPTDDLYLAGPRIYIDLLMQLPSDHESAMVIGHNPGLEELLEELTGNHHRLPTAALAHVHLPIDRWRDLATLAVAHLADLWRPKELTD